MTRVRVALPGDVPAVAGLETRCLEADAWSKGLVREGIAGSLPTVVYLVAEQEAQVVGYAVASLAGEIAELQRIAVDADHRRGGVATALLDAVVEAAARSETDRLLLEVRADNHGARAFYARQGFMAIGRRARYYVDGSAAVVLQLRLGGESDSGSGGPTAGSRSGSGA